MPTDSPSRSPALVVIGVSLQAVAYLLLFFFDPAPPAAAWLMILGLALSLPGVVLLGAPRRAGNLTWLRLTAGVLGVVLVAVFGAALLLPAEGPDGPLLLGLPRRASIVLLGIGLLPFLILPVVHAWKFDDEGLDPAALARLREEAARLRRKRAPS